MLDGIWMNIQHSSGPIMSGLHKLLSPSLVIFLAYAIKMSRSVKTAAIFVMVCLLSRCHVACGGHLLQHGEIGQGNACYRTCQEALSRWQLVAWRLVSIGCIQTRSDPDTIEGCCLEQCRIGVCGSTLAVFARKRSQLMWPMFSREL